MARYDDLKTGPIAYAAFISSVLLLVILLLIRALCFGWVEAEDARKLTGARYAAADADIRDQKERIGSYGKEMVTITPPAGQESTDAQPSEEERLRIPVERAKELLLQDLTSQASPKI